MIPGASKLGRERGTLSVAGIDLAAEVARLAPLRAFGGPRGPLARRHPELHVRRAGARPRSCLGRAWPEEWRISVTAYPGIRAGDALETLVHELAHLCVGRGRGSRRWHGARFRAVLHAAIGEAYGVAVEPSPNCYHGHYAEALERGLAIQPRLFDLDAPAAQAKLRRVA